MRRRGFTITELLVVISTITLLSGILAPVLSAARHQTKALVCSSNIKQLTLALTIYEQENGTFPYGFDDSTAVKPPGGYPGSGTRDLQGWWWFHFLTDTLGENFDKDTTFWCPSRNVEDPYILCGNYGVNQAICKNARKIGNSEFFGTPLALNRIRRPAGTLLVVDSGYSLISWRAATNANLPDSRFENTRREGAFYVPGLTLNKERFLEETISPAHEQDAIDGRHPNKTVNVGFADSHTAYLKADDLCIEQINDSYYNLSPLWLPR